jgi:hypothetical protein
MRHYVLFLLLFSAVLAGCGGETAVSEPAGEPAVAVADADPTATATVVPIVGGGGVSATAEPTAAPVVPTAEATAVPTVEPTIEPTAVPPTETPEPDGNDPCLVGTWRVANFEEYLLAAFDEAMAEAGTQIPVSVQASGDLLLSFDGERMSMSETNFAVTMTMMGQTVETNIDAVGDAAYTTENGVLLGQIERLDIAETNQGVAFNFGSMAGEPVTYVCTADTLSWSLESLPIPIQLTRVN